jgi:PASTA domain
VPDTVHVPGISKPVPKWAGAAGLAAVTVLVIVYFRKKSAAAAAAPAAASTSQYPPDGTTGNPSDPYSTDPATSQTYGNEAAGSGGTLGAFSGGAGGISGGSSYPWDGTYGNTSDPYSQDPSTGQTYGNEGTSGSGAYSAGGPPFATNAAWSGWAIQQMTTTNPNQDPGALTDALGVYLNGQAATAAQKTLIFDAEAIAGRPPVAGPGGYPPSVRAAASSGPGHAATVTVPKVTGMSVDKAMAALKAGHLKGRLHGGAPRGTTLVINSQTPPAGRRVPENSTVDLSWAVQKKKR